MGGPKAHRSPAELLLLAGTPGLEDRDCHSGRSRKAHRSSVSKLDCVRRPLSARTSPGAALSRQGRERLAIVEGLIDNAHKTPRRVPETCVGRRLLRFELGEPVPHVAEERAKFADLYSFTSTLNGATISCGQKGAPLGIAPESDPSLVRPSRDCRSQKGGGVRGGGGVESRRDS